MTLNRVPCSAATPAGCPQVRLDVGYHLWRSTLTRPVPVAEVLVVADGTVPETAPTPPMLYCEIGDIDSSGRTNPTLISDSTLLDEGAGRRTRTLDRLTRKIATGKAVTYDDWHVLVPSVRTYLRKFTVTTGLSSDPPCWFTTDLIGLAPSAQLMARTGLPRPDATCLLLLMLLGPLGGTLDALSRTGKSYPTLHRDDLRDGVVDGAMLDQHMTGDWCARACEVADVLRRRHSLDETYRHLTATR